ncbi:MAG: alpha/beta fold hydrolase [Acidobacteria bacterium]|nr:MAG: alpha/beta fold hydrolase [Acidobacteriota bacterium]
MARCGGIELCYRTLGDPAGRPLLMIMGLASQMYLWPEGLCQALADRGHFLVLFDNRDVGRSTHLKEAGHPPVLRAILRALLGLPVRAPYTLDDMAGDAAGLLDVLGVERAHVCGVSLGGMIGQTLAIRRPERVLSLTSIMASGGNRRRRPTARAIRAVVRRNRVRSREQYVERFVELFRTIGSPAFPFEEAFFRSYAELAWQRGLSRDGIARQLVALIAHGDRGPALARLRLPTLVIHGDRDPLVPLAGGLDVARAVPGAELLVVEGMGHDLPRAVWPRVVDAISALTERAGTT